MESTWSLLDILIHFDMKIFGFEIRRASSSMNYLGMPYIGVNTGSTSAMMLSTVYRCVEVVSDSVAQLPIEPFRIDANGFRIKYKEHPTYDILCNEPNDDMTRFTFLKTMVSSVLLRGNAYAYIDRDDKGNAVELQFKPTDQVEVVWVLIDGIHRKRYRVNGFYKLVEPQDMIHVLNFSYDGIVGVSTLKHAGNTIGLATSSEKHASGFFKGGGSMSGILKLIDGRLRDGQKKDIIDAWKSTFDPLLGNPNGVAVLDGNMQYQPVSINPSDAQLLETRQFNVVDICRFFGVSPVKAFDLSKSSYSTVEATQLAFLTDTLAPILDKFELEFRRKLYKPSERKSIEVRFDRSELLSADKAAQSAYYKNLFDVGAISPNEIRKINGLPPLENGDQTFVQVNTHTLSNAVKNAAPNKDVIK